MSFALVGADEGLPIPNEAQAEENVDIVLDVDVNDPRLGEAGGEIELEFSTTPDADVPLADPLSSVVDVPLADQLPSVGDDDPDADNIRSGDEAAVSEAPNSDDDNEYENVDIDNEILRQQKLRKRKGKDTKSLIVDVQLRTQHAKRTGKALLNKCKLYEAKTGARVFFKSQFKGSKSVHSFTHGTNWSLEDEDSVVVPPIPITSSVVEEAVGKAFTSSLTPLLRELRTRARSPISSTSTSAFLSPQKHPSAVEKSQCCTICNKKEVIKDFIVYESQWIGCNGDGKDCPKFVHADCLGFPGVTSAEVKKMPHYYCHDHLSFGRQFKKVGHAYAEENCSTAAAATEPEPPKKKSRRGKR